MKADRFVIRPKLLVAFASLALLPLAAGVAAATRAISGIWSGHRDSPWSRSRGKRRQRWFLEKMDLLGGLR